MEWAREESPFKVTTSDPADVFVELYDHMSVVIFRSDAVADWFSEPDFEKITDPVREACLAHGALDAQWISEIVSRGVKYELAVLAGIDEALVSASPWSASTTPAGMLAVRDRYLQSGRFNLKTAGGLLPRRSYPGRPRSGKEKHHYFRVVRVSAQVWDESYVNKVLASTDDPWHDPASPVPVAFVPFLESYADINISLFTDKTHGDLRYRMKARASVADRLPSVLEELDRSGAQLAILPEGCLSTEILRAWKRLLRSRPPGWRSKLRWILLGTGPVGGRGNRAVLVDRWGRELLRQDKLSDFTLTDWQFRTWGMSNPPKEALRPGATVREDVPRDVVFRTLDAFLGRIGVLVCESLSRWPDGRHDEIIGAGPSHVMAPVFSKPLRRQGWEEAASSQLSNLVGAWVMVSNSLATAAAESQSEPADGTRFSCLISGPFSDERTRYQLIQMFGCSDDHLSAAEVKEKDPEEVGDPPPLPYVRTASASAAWFPELDG